MKKVNVLCFIASVALSVFADGEIKTSESDWDGICLAITNACVRDIGSGNAWMTIATAKLNRKLSADQMLKVLKLCIEGLGDSPQETRACEWIVESISGTCGTNALPYVEYLIENDRRDYVACGACRQLLRMNPDLDRSLLFVEKMLDPKSGRGDGSRIAVYQAVCDAWKKADVVGDLKRKEKLASFFDRRALQDKDFDRLAPRDFLASRRDASTVEGQDWEKACFVITNCCVRSRHPEPAWDTIAAVKVRYKFNAEKMLDVFRRCIEGLGDSPVEKMACERIVHCLASQCGTNALPYVEYLIENDRREGVVACAYRQLVKIKPDLDRQLLFAAKILDPKSGRDDCSRIVVYQELCDIWARIERDGSRSDKITMIAFFEERRQEDALFRYLSPQDFRPPKNDDAIEWERVCYVISNTFANARASRDGYLTLVHVRNSYNLSRAQLLVALERCLGGLRRDGREQKASELIVSHMGEVCGTNAVPCLERIALRDGRESVAACAFRELAKLKQQSSDMREHPADSCETITEGGR